VPRIVGVDIPPQKRVEIALTYIYGVGRVLSNKILSEAGVNPNVRAKDLTPEDVSKINTVIQGGFKVEGDLRREVTGNIKRLVSIHCYRGLRHRSGLPVRGQKTRRNARTRKGPRRATVALKKKIAK
jgi:small subunit ribosomal protein S13